MSSELSSSGQSPPIELVQAEKTYGSLVNKLKMFKKYIDGGWISEVEDQKWGFKPTWANKMGHLATTHGQMFLAMSGTMPPARDWAWNLGIEDLDTVAFKSLPSTFPVENRPIKYRPVADFGMKSAQPDAVNAMVEEIDRILEDHPDEKGLIHTVSYVITKTLMAKSRHKERLMTHNLNGKERGEAAKEFMESKSPLVLVSPSFNRGLDLAYDLGRFQILCKIPFKSLGDKQTARRRWSGKPGERWYLGSAARDIVQQYGRVVRAEDDWGVTYILDERFKRFHEENEQFFPKWFTEAIEWEK